MVTDVDGAIPGLERLCAANGMIHHVTKPYTPQLSAVAKKAVRTIKSTIAAALISSGCEKLYWPLVTRIVRTFWQKFRRRTGSQYGSASISGAQTYCDPIHIARILGDTAYRKTNQSGSHSA